MTDQVVKERKNHMYTNANFASIGTGHACTLLKLSMHKKTDRNWFQNLKQLYYHLHTYYLKQCYKTFNQGQNPDSIHREGDTESQIQRDDF